MVYLDKLQEISYTPGTRAACFIIALCFTYSAMFSAIFEYSLPAGNDIAALFPKYLSLRKSMYVCAMLTVLINPWYLMGSASIFISFLASYQIFLSSITGVLLCHYYIISRGFLEMDDLFTARKDGWNWRAYAAYIVGIIPNFYWFLNNMGVSAPIVVTRLYYFAYPIGLFKSFMVYWGLSVAWKPAINYTLSEWREPDDYVRAEERLDTVQVTEFGTRYSRTSGESRESMKRREGACWLEYESC